LHNLPTARPILDEINAYREALIRGIDAQIGHATREAMVDALAAIRIHLTGAARTDDADDSNLDPYNRTAPSQAASK
jgi:hypothetical protein